MDGTSMLFSLLALLIHWGRTVTSDPQHYCYTELVTALARSCDRIYAADSSATTTSSSRGRRSAEEGAEIIRRRLPRNIVEQCCRRPCSRATLQRYCSTVRVSRRLPTDANGNGTSVTEPTESMEISSTFRSRGQRSTTPSPDGRGSSLQSLTESPSPDPVPVGDFNFYP